MAQRVVAGILLSAIAAVGSLSVTPASGTESRQNASARIPSVHTIRTNETGQCALPAGTGDGAAILQAPCSQSGWDFVLVDSITLTHEIRHVATGRCLDAAGGGASGNGVAVLLWTCHSGSNQRWFVRQRDDDTYEIKNVRTGRCLDVRSPTTWIPIYQWDCHGGIEQQWVLR